MMLFNKDIEKTSEFNQFKNFLRMPITSNFVDTLANKAVLAIRNPILSNYDSPPSTPFDSLSLSGDHQIHNFISNLINGSRVQASTLFGAMVYLERLKCAVPAISFTRPDAPQAALLASLLLAGKFLNDASPKNKHWATYAKIFSLTEINAFEKQFFYYLNYDLNITIIELLFQFRSFAHLPSTNSQSAILSPLPSNFPSTPKSAVFPPMCCTPTNSRFPNEITGSPISHEMRSLRKKGSNLQLSPVVLPSNTPGNAPFTLPSINQIASNGGMNSGTKIRELSNSNSTLYRRRTNKREPRKKSSQLSLNVSSEDRNQTLNHNQNHNISNHNNNNSFTVNSHQHTINTSIPFIPSNVEGPLSAPLSMPKGKELPLRAQFTLRSNVPNESCNFLPTPTTAVPLAVNNSIPNMDLSLKLPPIQYPSFEDRKEMLPSIRFKANYS